MCSKKTFVLERLIQELDKLDETYRPIARLELSAKLLEDTAYDIAGGVETSIVSRMILISRDLSELAKTIDASLVRL